MKQHLWKDSGACFDMDTNLFFDKYEDDENIRPIIENLYLLRDNLGSDDYLKIKLYVNSKTVKFQILINKLLQCIQLQGFLSLYYFTIRIINILFRKFSV